MCYTTISLTCCHASIWRNSRTFYFLQNEASLHRAGAHKSNRQSAAPFKIFDLGKADERYALYVVGVRNREKASNQ